MSAALKARPTPVVAPRPSLRTPLRLVPQRRTRAGRAPFLALFVALLASGLLGLLALNTVLAQDAFRLHELQSEGRVLADREQALLTEVEDLQAPRALTERATGLGMVPGGPPVFLRLPDGVVVGAGSPGVPAGAAPGDAGSAGTATTDSATTDSTTTDSTTTDSTDAAADSTGRTGSTDEAVGTTGGTDTAGGTR